MRHSYCNRVYIKTGEVTKIDFGEIDGKIFSSMYIDKEGYTLRDALLIVNRWNYVATLSHKVEYLYYLPTAEGAD